MASVALAPGLSRKLKKVLDSWTNSTDVLASLSTLSTLYTENMQPARRNLKSTIEKIISFLASESTQQDLVHVEEEVNALAAESIYLYRLLFTGTSIDFCRRSFATIALVDEIRLVRQTIEIIGDGGTLNYGFLIPFRGFVSNDGGGGTLTTDF